MNSGKPFVIAMLLFPALMLAQAAAPKPAPAAPPPAAVAPPPYPVMSTAAKNRARQVFGYFNSDQPAPLYATFSPQMKQSGNAAKWADILKKATTGWGHEQKMLGENFVPDLFGANTVYLRYSQFSKSKDPIFTVVSLDEQGKVPIFYFRPDRPPTGYQPADYKDKTKLRLPFNGDWFVYQGGRYFYQNQNVYLDDARYAMTFSLLKEDRPFSGDGSKNEDFYCFGQPILAPADGTVVQAIGNYPDNQPGRPNQFIIAGNRVMISHGDQEYSVLTHLKRGSIKVKAGAKVKQGDVVGECGNSGNSPVPHLEYRLQNSNGIPIPQTLPVQFVDYVADGVPVAVGEPLRGQTIHNGSAAAAVATTTTSEHK